MELEKMSRQELEKKEMNCKEKKCSCRDSDQCWTILCECFKAGDDCGESCLCQDDCANSMQGVFESASFSLSDSSTTQANTHPEQDGQLEETPKKCTPELDNTPPRQDEQLEPPKKRCTHCGTEDTPQWRSGPSGPSTLCNACGTFYLRNKTLSKTYRPKASPTFDDDQHTNRTPGTIRCRNRQGSAQVHAPQGPSPGLNDRRLNSQQEEDNDDPPKK